LTLGAEDAIIRKIIFQFLNTKQAACQNDFRWG